jgi:hypothetical protein
MTNILNSIINLIENNILNIQNIKNYEKNSYKTRINNSGEALENIIKDSFLNNFNSNNKILDYSKFFSYCGNQNNPPDLIIKQGDAIEIKKIQTKDGAIALNSSHPKNKLYRDSPMLTNACKNSEDNWFEKDICYIIGNVNDNIINDLWFIYGDCFCAEPLTYQRIKDKITEGINDLNLDCSKTNEIAKIKNVDPLGITDLRVRGMWSIKNPNRIFNYLFDKNKPLPLLKALILESKFHSFDDESKFNISTKCQIKKVNIQNPNNPAKLLNAVLIEYYFK